MHLQSHLAEFDRLQAERDYSGALACIQALEESLDDAKIDDELRLEVDRRHGKIVMLLGDFATAGVLLERALRSSERLYGEDHPTTIAVLSDLGARHVVAGEYAAARSELERAAKLAEQHYGPEHVQVGKIYHNLGVLAQKSARFGDAVTAFEKSLAVRVANSGPDHLEVSDALNGLGWVCAQVGQLERAVKLLERALAIKENALGAKHFTLAFVHQNLGGVYVFSRDYVQARRHLEKAIAIVEPQFPNHETVIGSYSNLSEVEMELGQFERARQHAERALQAAEEALGSRHPIFASVLHNMAALCRSEGDVGSARRYVERALDLKRELVGEEHPDTARARLELGRLDLEAGNWEVAEDHFQAALDVIERAYDGASLDAASASALLAEAKEGAGDLAAARRAFERAITELDDVFGPGHPHVSDPLLGLSRIARREGRLEEARTLALRSLDVVSTHRQRAFAVLDQRRKLRVNAVMRHHLGVVFASMDGALAEEVRKAVAHWFAYKGAIAAFQSRFQQLRAIGDDATIALLEQHEASLRRLAAVTLAIRSDATTTKSELDALSREIDEQVTKLSSTTVELGLGDVSEGVSPEDLERCLDDDEAFVDYAWFDDDVYAIAVRPGHEVAITRLADSGSVASHVASLRSAITSGGGDLQGDSSILHRLLIDPVSDVLQGVRKVVIAPDGVLRFLPFEILANAGPPIVERWELGYVPNARTLLQLRKEQRVAPRHPPALFGDPDFADVGVAAWRSATQQGVDIEPMGKWIESLRFPRLPGSRAEVERIHERLPDAAVFLGTDATAANLFALQGPRLLHLATHGFVNDAEDSGIDPMLRAVLALAGARRSVRERNDHGLVPALRLAGLDLRGTELVVLSACDTALGAVQVGEGVASLDQALLGAGARAVVSTLWKVSDVAAQEFMVRFYDALAEGISPGTALQRVKAEMARTHPVRDWAAFVLNGEGWASA